MGDNETKMLALEAQAAKLTTSELVWMRAMRTRWDDPMGRAITSREWRRVEELTAEAASR